jgi:hypothetical protein
VEEADKTDDRISGSIFDKQEIYKENDGNKNGSEKHSGEADR